MMAGITSPARPWFQLNSSNRTLNEVTAVKEWLSTVQGIMYDVYSASNIYNQLHATYNELGVFGTAAIGIFENFENVIRGKNYTIGSYMLGMGADDKVDTLYREYQLTVGQVVKEFGEKNVTADILKQWQNGNTENAIDIVYLVEPNDNRNTTSPLAKDKAFRSVYYVACNDKTDNAILRRSGFDEFPMLTPRWDVVGEETYSHDCPGMLALGDTKGLQLGEKRLYQALDKVGNPPLQGDSAMKNDVNGGVPNPGQTIWHSSNSKGLETVYGAYAPRIDMMQDVQSRVEQRINTAFFVDLFLMLANSDRRQITAREVAEKHEEKLLMLGPVLERLHTELLDPLINRTFNILQRNGVLPPPPPELAETEISVEYVSVLAQAQKLVGLTSIERTVGFAMEMSAVWPEARHKVNPHEALDQYASDSGTDPRIIRSDDEVKQLVEQEQQAQQQAAQVEQSGMALDNAQKVSEIQDPQGTAATLKAAGLA